MTCHLIVRHTDVEIVVHQTGERLTAASLDDAYDLAHSNGWAVSYVQHPACSPLAVFA